MASVRKRANGMYYYRFVNEHGKSIERKGSRNKREAVRMISISSDRSSA